MNIFSFFECCYVHPLLSVVNCFLGIISLHVFPQCTDETFWPSEAGSVLHHFPLIGLLRNLPPQKTSHLASPNTSPFQTVRAAEAPLIPTATTTFEDHTIVGKLPSYLMSLLKFKSICHNTRSQSLLSLEIPYIKTDIGKIAFKLFASHKWNTVQEDLRLTQFFSVNQFKSLLDAKDVPQCSCFN